MSFFKSSKNYIGIDIGSDSIKMIEINKENNRPKLSTYGYAENLKNITRNNTETAQKQTADIIVNIHKQAGFKSRQVIAALHNFSVFSSVISLPRVRESELSNNIILEAKKFVPIPLEEVILDWKIITPQNNNNDLNSKLTVQKEQKNNNFDSAAESSTKKNINILKTKPAADNDNIEILLTVAPKKLVRRYINIFKLSKLNLTSLETESFALTRALLYKDNQRAMILDIGSVASDIIIIENGFPIISRSIDVGGITITQAIEKSLNINTARAEQFKRDIGLSAQESQASIRQVIETAFAPVLNEARYSLELYKSRDQILDKIILSGGSALLGGLADFISKFLNLKVYIGNPWDKIIYPQELEPVLTEIGPRFTVSIGLALREILV
ncbi:MAG: pilus assembly protein PilM [Patescibacteria group bacterium]